MSIRVVVALVASLAVSLVVLTSSSCALLVSIGLGSERGRSNVLVHTSDEGIVFLERKPKDPRATVVLVHGFGGSKDHWTRFIAHMPSDVWVIAPDLPGFGESPKIESERYDLETQTTRLTRFLDGLEVGRFHLVGNSMGGHLSALVALQAPERVQSLVLFNPAGMRGPVPSAMDKLTEGGAVPFVIQSKEDFQTLLKHSFVISPRIPEFLLDHFAEQAALSYAFSKKIKDDQKAAPARIVDRIATLEPPTLVVWGDSDGVLDPSAVPLWRAKVPGGLVVVMRETGHGPQIERPEEAAELVLEWWRRNAGSKVGSKVGSDGLKVTHAAPMKVAWTASTSSPLTPVPATAP
jgi:abhydrolase domain-containing protein 6